ncbi:uncharacterized protein LOC125026986 [Penaeus chinensis]|uniref:uncharacterized protein LOC125026986 n=1 Tax=Penaeus chinensis TaxID=139456 RepID=UPI001FB60B42|nr:uncharacterized protein LOC125026986 [Penaeus chinensis]
MAHNFLATVVVFPLLQTIVAGLRVTEVEVPRYLVVGQSATLRCHVALEGEVLYSLKWWKDGKQFYQYIPQNNPPAVVFTVPGITINPAKSGLDEVEMMDVQSSSSGQYRCEVVAEAPTFTTHVLSANMTIVGWNDTIPGWCPSNKGASVTVYSSNTETICIVISVGLDAFVAFAVAFAAVLVAGVKLVLLLVSVTDAGKRNTNTT